MAKTGRNEPCPCGSGRVYGECCFSADVMSGGRIDPAAPGPAPNARIADNTSSPLSDFRSMMVTSDDLEALCGLSREQIFSLLYDPFSSPRLAGFNLGLKKFPDSAFFRLFDYLMQGVASKGLKTTAQGNLPVKFVNEAALWFYGEEEYHERKKIFSFRTELDFPVFHTVRILAQMSGFIRKYKNQLHLTRSGGETLKNGMNGETFHKLFSVYTTRFNWAYNDRYPELSIVQQSFLFTLYLLHRFGGRFRAASFYEDMFIAAFPEEVPAVPKVFLDTGADTLRGCYSLRSLSRFAHFFGFIKLRDAGSARWIGKAELKKTDFLDDWVRFTVS
jgi:hypothetical protein